MTILVLEDEAPARAWLTQVLARHRPGAAIAALSSVADALAWLAGHPAPDLIVADIQLADGLSLEIFEHTQPGCPVIFTTAYDEYLVEAMQRDGIAYLLKPLREDDVAGALAKYDRLASHFTERVRGLLGAWLGGRSGAAAHAATDPPALARNAPAADPPNHRSTRQPSTAATHAATDPPAVARDAAAADETSNRELTRGLGHASAGSHPSTDRPAVVDDDTDTAERSNGGPARSRTGAPQRLVARRRDGFVVLSLTEIAYFVVVDKLVEVVTRDGRRFAVDQTLGELERDLADEVFRVNRQYLVHASAVAGFRPFVKGKLLVELAPAAAEEVVVSQENAARFRAWLAG